MTLPQSIRLWLVVILIGGGLLTFGLLEALLARWPIGWVVTLAGLALDVLGAVALARHRRDISSVRAADAQTAGARHPVLAAWAIALGVIAVALMICGIIAASVSL